jgi:hypothetical protein
MKLTSTIWSQKENATSYFEEDGIEPISVMEGLKA